MSTSIQRALAPARKPCASPCTATETASRRIWCSVTPGTAFPAGYQPAAFWYCSSSAAVPLEPGTYWAMIHSGGDPGIVRYYYDGPANWYGNADVYADGSSDTFGPGGTGDGTISMYVNYVPDSQLHFAGRRTVGARVSSPMSCVI